MSDASRVSTPPAVGLCVAVPIYGPIAPEFLTSIVKLTTTLATRGVSVGLATEVGHSVITIARNSLAATFLANRADQLLFVDADQAFEPEAILRLLDYARKYDPGIVAAPVPLKHDVEPKFNVTLDDAPSGPVVRDGFARALLVGAGCMLIARRVFEAMQPTLPLVLMARRPLREFFRQGTTDSKKGPWFVQEDHEFCMHWRSLGGEIWVDLDARIMHVGRRVFGGESFGEYLRRASGGAG